MAEKEKFDSEKKMWGVNEVSLTPSYLGATRLKEALTALKRIHQGRVLEVGCGGGAFTRAIKRYRPELEVIGGDINQEALHLAREADGGVKYQLADVYHLPFADDIFEAVVSFDVWEHLERPQKAFEEVYRVLKPQGVFHFFVPIEGNHLSLYQLLPERIYQIKKEYSGHIQSYTDDQLIKMLRTAGFKIEYRRHSLFYFYQWADLLFFFFLRLKKKKVAISVEGYLELREKNFFNRSIAGLKTLFSWLTYLENELFQFFPGGGVHFTVVKRRK